MYAKFGLFCMRRFLFIDVCADPPSKMDENSKIEQRVVIKFFTKLGNGPSEIESQLRKVYGDLTLPSCTIKHWAAEFKHGRENFQDDPRSGRPSTSTTDENVAKIDRLVRADRRIKIKEIEREVSISRGSIVSILHDALGLSKVCARWIPRLLTNEQKENRATLSLEMMHIFDRDPNNFRSRIVTGDETWIYSYDPETKEMSKQWVEKGSRPPVKAKVVKSAGKTMLTLFFDSEGWLLADFLQKGTTINGLYYANILEQLKEAIKEKRRGKLTKGVILLDDNAPVHRAAVALDALHRLQWSRLNHPPYSPDLAPSDFRVFPDLKKTLKGKRFEDENELKTAVMRWLDEQPKSYWEKAINDCRQRWQVCFNRDGSYVEK